MRNFEAYIFDLDGTVYLDNTLISGAEKLFLELNSRNIPYCFVTNTTSQTVEQIHKRILAAGLIVDLEKIITPVSVVKSYLREKKIRKIQIIQCEAIHTEFSEFDISNQPEAIILADDGNGIDYDSINKAFQFALNGAEILTLQQNKFYAKNGKLIADLGFYVAGFEYILETKIKNFGKPSKQMLSYAQNCLHVLNKKNIALIGDDIEFDVLGAQNFGFKGILVKTGKYRAEIVSNYKEKPDFIIESIADIIRTIGK